MAKLYYPYVLSSSSPIPHLFEQLSRRLSRHRVTIFSTEKRGSDLGPHVREIYVPPEGSPWGRRIRFGLGSLNEQDLIHTGGRGRRHYRISRIVHLRNPGLRHVHTLRVDVNPDSDRGPLSYKRKLVAEADAVTAVSEHTAETAREHLGVSPSVVYNGVDADRFRPDYESPNLFEELGINPPIVLYVGSFQPRKNPMDVARVSERLPEVNFLMVGDGEQFRAVRRRASELENLWLPGHLPKDRLPAIYANATAFLFPSVREGCPNVVLEAMASELPVVGYRATSMPELVDHGTTGHLVDQGDVDALAEAIDSVLDDADSLGVAAREYVLSNHNFDQITSQYDSIYRVLLEP